MFFNYKYRKLYHVTLDMYLTTNYDFNIMTEELHVRLKSGPEILPVCLFIFVIKAFQFN